MQRRDVPRVSDPVIESLEIARPTTGFATASSIVIADVERETTVAYDEHAPRLRAFVISATRSGDVADDIVQDAFMRLVVELKAGRRPGNVGGWLYRVCANLIVSRSRRTRVADKMRGFLVRRDLSPSPEDAVLRDERDRTLALALARLPPDARVALLLAARGMSAIDIGLAIHRTPGATRTYLCRARIKLRDELATLGMKAQP